MIASIRTETPSITIYPDGRMGSDPGQATPEKGGELVKQAAESLLADVAEFSNEQTPGLKAAE